MSYFKKLFRRRRGAQMHPTAVGNDAAEPPAAALPLAPAENNLQPLSTTQMAIEANVASRANEPSIAAESGPATPQHYRTWPSKIIPFVDLLQLFQAIREGSEHVATIRLLCYATKKANEVIHKLDEETQDWVFAHEAIAEHIRFFETALEGMIQEDAAPDPDSPLITPIRNYLQHLSTIVLLQLSDHGLLSAAERGYPEVQIALWNTSSLTPGHGRTFELVSQLKHAMYILRSFIDIYTGVEPPSGTSNDVNLEGVDYRLPDEMLVRRGPVARTGTQHRLCLSGTRKRILAAIEQWGEQRESGVRPFCLVDRAGTGKSTISNHMAQKWAKRGRLAARFFFSRGNNETKIPEELLPWLIEELLANHPELAAEASTSPVKTNFHFPFLPLPERWKQSVSYYTSKLKAGPYFFVIDALDECAKEVRLALLDCLLKTFHNPDSPLPNCRLFITTRPESDILEDLTRFPSISGHNIMGGLGETATDLADVTLYIHDQLKYVSQVEVTAEERQILVKRSVGLFIFASTACTMIKRSYTRPDVIRRIISMEDSNLNELYQEVIKLALPGGEDSLGTIQKVLGVILAADRALSPQSISDLLTTVSSSLVQEIVQGLGAVLASGNEDDPVFFLHPTFHEFLLQQSRSKLYAINIQVAHRSLAATCLQLLLSELRRDNTRIKTSIQPTLEVESNRSLNAGLQHYTTEALRYASLHWVNHASHALHQPLVRALIRELFIGNLLNWIELSSLIEGAEGTLQSILYLKHHLEIHARPEGSLQTEDCAENLLNWCQSIIEFMKKTRKLWENSTPQLYLTALTYWQRPGSVFTHYASKRSADRPDVRMLVEKKDENIPTVVFRGHLLAVLDIAFSPNGRHLASCSSDGTVRIWNVLSGLQEAEFELPGVRSIAYLSTGAELIAATGSGFIQRLNLDHRSSLLVVVDVAIFGCKIRVSPKDDFVLCGTWDGELVTIDLHANAFLAKVQAHATEVVCIDISADGELFASSSKHNTIYLWKGDPNFSNPQPLRVFSCGDGECIPGHTISLSSKNRLLAAGSKRRVHLWNIDNGDMSANIKEETHIYLSTFSNDGRYLATAMHSLQLRDGVTGDVLSRLNEAWQFSNFVFTRDGSRLAGIDYKTICAWHTKVILEDGEKQSSLYMGSSCWAFFNDCQRLLQIKASKTFTFGGKELPQLTIWDVSEGKKTVGPQGLRGEWRKATNSPHGERYFARVGEEYVEVPDTSSRDSIESPAYPLERTDRPLRAVVSPCEKLIAIVRGSRMGPYDARSLKLVWQEVLLLSIDHEWQLTLTCTIILPAPLVIQEDDGKGPIMVFDRHSQHLRVDDMVWDVSQPPALRLSHAETTTRVLEWPAPPQCGLRWNNSYSRLEFEKFPVENYPSPYGETSECRIDGDLAVLSSWDTGEFVVLDFRHMRASSQVSMRGYGAIEGQGHETEKVQGYEIGEGE